MGGSTLISDMIDKFFPAAFSLETPRVLLEPIARRDNEIDFSITDKHEKSVCGSASYIFPGNNAAQISWQWLAPEETDQGLIKNLKFAMISYAFEVMKMEKIEMLGDGTFVMTKKEWPAAKEMFFPELI